MARNSEWSAYLDEFRTEAREHLRALDDQLLQLERDPGQSRPIREMFLSAHTIKGGAAMLEIADVRDLAHAMEDVLATLRDAGRPLDSELADLLFRALDALRELVSGAAPGGPGLSGEYAALAAALRVHAAAPDEPDRARPPVPAPAEGRPKVLLVEDSATVRMLESMLLEEAGFVVDAVADGHDALQRAVSQSYELLVTSVETRGLRGLDLAAALRGTRGQEQLPIVLMSSDDNSEHRRRAAEIGVQAYIRKGSLGQRRLLEAARELVPPR